MTTRVQELTTALQTERDKIASIGAAFTMEDGNVVVSTEKRDALLAATANVKSIRSLIAAEQEVGEVNAFLAAPASTPAAQADAAEVHAAEVDAANGGIDIKSLGDYFIESAQFKAGRGDTRPFIKVSIEGHEIRALGNEQKDVYGGAHASRTGGTITVPSLGTVQNIGITEARLRQRHVRDLFPKATTTATMLVGVRETGFTNNAAVVTVRTPDGSAFTTKPQSNVTFAPQMYPIARIAHWIKAHKDILADEPRLRDFLNRRMVDGVMLAEDRELLYGAGGGEAMTGLMNTPGVQEYTGSASDPRTAQIRRAATLAMIAEYEPNGLVVHPLSWEDLELETTTDGVYRLAMNVAVGGEKRVWGMDIVATTAMNEGQYLLGGFGLGAQLYDREQVNVQVSTEDDKNFEQNLVTIRAEERVALTVDRPESYVIGTLVTA